MQTVEEILEQVKHLPLPERRRLADALQEELLTEDASAEATRLAALDQWIARAGSGHSDFDDVARDKYKHLAEAYSDKK
jgi:hypothetical protein